MESSSRSSSRFNGIDWDFSGYFSESPFSPLHWHPGRFVSQLPAGLIGLFSKPSDVVLDPFVGSGTTLVEAQRLGRRGIGIDINPVSCLVSSAKTLPITAKKISRVIATVKSDVMTLKMQSKNKNRKGFENLVPTDVQVEKWYSPNVRTELTFLWNFISTYKGHKKVIARFAFSGILLTVCRETRHWGYVCDNSTPKTEKPIDVFRTYGEFLDKVMDAYVKRDEELVRFSGDDPFKNTIDVMCGDARSILMTEITDEVDLVVTSPPYFGVCDYVKSQRLSFEWFGYDIEELRREEIGARSKRHRRTAYEDYIGDISAVFAAVSSAIKVDGYCAVILGQSKAREDPLPSIKTAILGSGFMLDADISRRISSQRRQAPSVTGERLMVFRKK